MVIPSHKVCGITSRLLLDTFLLLTEILRKSDFSHFLYFHFTAIKFDYKPLEYAFEQNPHGATTKLEIMECGI
jgi:hypothetical protein